MPLQILTDGTRLHYTSLGEGQPTLVPCIATSVPYERSFGKLTTDHRFIFVELRGTGRSEGDNDDLSLDGFADDLEDLRERLGLERVAVMGQSANGLVAARYAHKYPDATEYAVMIGTPVPRPEGDQSAYWEEHADDERRRVATENDALLASENVDRFTQDGRVRWFNLQSHQLWYDPLYDMSWMWDPSLLKPAVSTKAISGWVTWDLRGALLETPVPFFAAFGKYDFHCPPTPLLDDIPGVTVEVFERSGHFPYMEEPEEFASRYRAWITNLREQSAGHLGDGRGC